MPHGFRDGNIALLVMAIFGEFVQGALPTSARFCWLPRDMVYFFSRSEGVSLDSVMM